MLKRIVNFSLHFRGIIIALAFILLGYGTYSITHARYDVYPNFVPPQLTIKTLAPGFSPRQVEKLVTTPIEQALAGGVGARTTYSHSLQGISVIKVLFPSATNIYRDQQAVSQRLAQVSGTLPPDVHTPVLMPINSSIRWVTVVGITSKTNDIRQLRTVADWIMQPRLLAVHGVSEVAIYGGLQKDYRIELIPVRLIQYGLTVRQVLAAARSATGLEGAGFVTTPNQTMTLRVHGQIQSLQQLGETTVAKHGSHVITLADVADIRLSHLPQVGAVSIMGQPGVLLMIGQAYGSNLLKVSAGVTKALRSLQPVLAQKGVVLHGKILQSADFITVALHNLMDSLLIGAGLVILVLVLFLGDWRTSLISCLAIPLSLLAAITILIHLGQTINIMTLGGLAVAIGEVVDDAVIDVENITRRLRINALAAVPRNALGVVLHASLEVRSAVVFATFAVILVFLPIFGLGGLAGRFFTPLGMAYIAAVLSSLLLALTLTPALCMTLLPQVAVNRHDAWLTGHIKAGYRRLLTMVETWRVAVIMLVVAVTLTGLALAPFLKTEFFPRLNERNYVVHMALVAGSSLQQSIAIGNRVTAGLRKISYIQEIEQRSGRSNLAGDVLGPQYSEYLVRLKPLTPTQAKKFRADMAKLIKTFPGVLLYYNSVLSERINETISGSGAPVAVQIIGNKFADIEKASAMITAVLKKVPGSRSVAPQTAWNAPEIQISLRRRQLQRWGLSPMDILARIDLLVHGLTIEHIYHGIRIWPLVVTMTPHIAHRIARIREIPIRTPDGTWIPLSDVARVYEGRGFYLISHINGQRAQMINIHLKGVTAGEYVKAAQQAMAKIHLPAGVLVNFTGSAEAAARAQHDLLVHSGIAVVGIVLLLFIVLKNINNVLLLLMNLPLALVGGVLAAWMNGGVLSLGALVGFITLFGITLRNSIMLMSHYQHLVNREGRTWNVQTAMDGAVDRLPAILMTALVAALGLLPLALGAGAPGREIEGPLAQVIVGGLFTSTLLNLIVLPTLAARWARFSSH
ncbi:MAG: efflux RND transporter permease subunit [Planctomycetes bacterium]|jgi:CzcA family heavy metal efflux pump|nr:efflux RND transporter permease subunit [Planctomycetota bacterium]